MFYLIRTLIETTTPLNEIEKQTIFLTLNDSNLYREFRRKQKASLYWPTVFVNVILFMIVSGTRGSVYKIFQLGIYFNITHFVLIMVALIHGFFYGSHICLNLFEKDSVYHKWSEYIIFQFLNGHIEDCAVVSATSHLCQVFSSFQEWKLVSVQPMQISSINNYVTHMEHSTVFH